MTSSHSRNWTLAAAILGSSMAFIDGTVVNIAIPVLQRSLGVTVSDAQWIVDAYLLVLSSLTLAGGALGDHLGRRKVFAIGIATFAAASAVCGAAANAQQLIAARALQGLGAALLVPGSLAIITATFPAGERGRAIGTWSSLTSLGVIAGPLFGGWLVQTVSWRAVFYINLPIAAITLLIVWFSMSPDRAAEEPGRIDWGGTLLVTIALAALTFGMIEAPSRGMRSSLVIGSLLLGTIAFVAFVALERRIESPIMPLTLFRSRVFSGANLLTLLLYAALSTVTFLLPFNLIQVQHYSPSQAGAAFLPFVVTMTILSRWTGGLADRFGPRLPLTVGPLLACCGFILLACPSIGGSYWMTFFPGVLTLGLGMATTVAPLTTTVMTSFGEEKHAGAASGINNTVARAAGLLSIALFGALCIMIFAPALDTRLASAGASPALRQAMAAQRLRLAEAKPPATLDAGERARVSAAVDQAFVRAFRISMLTAAALAALSAVGALVIGRPASTAGGHARSGISSG
ncbi:MAG TPA: DHA2 family efflux MFS transporter permease subunit [Thermoanaerobaculia bacterium]|nr:DHA2 family efflux MFS transporter permease subunit [Thermoanaerobaculia bacterium]